MIKASHHWFLFPFLKWYGWARIKLHFNKIYIEGDFKDHGLPLLVVPNHFSWYDGFFISSLNRKIFRRKYHVMMLEEQLKKHSFFSHTGAFSISRNPKCIMESLLYTIEILKTPKNMVTLFPQGQFESQYQKPVHFRKGIEWLLKNIKTDIQVVFVANLIEYFESARPNLFIYYSEYNDPKKNISNIEEDYNNFYEKSYNKNLQKINKLT